LPYTSSSQNHRDNFYYKRNNSKKISEKENIRKIGDSFNKKSNYKFNICPLGSLTIEINKNNNSYQIQNLTNEKNNMEKEKLIINKGNIRLKNKLDKNLSFITKKEKRENSFNKKEITTNLLKHITLKSTNNNDNIFLKNLESNSAYALLDSNKMNNNNFEIKPNYLQYDFEKIKLMNKKNFMNLIKNMNKSNKSKENNKNNIYKENGIINRINIQKIKNKVNNNSNNLYLKLNNNIMKNMNNNRHNININLHKLENSNNKSEYFNEKNEKEIELTKEEKLIYGNRTMKNYNKIKLLGKGGCGIVWLCYKNNLNENTDIKKRICRKTNIKKIK
jgi:hypothetical protein